jgi:hypothetical protein
MPDLQLYRNPAGRLVLTMPDGQVYEGVVPVRAFPISDAEFGMAIMSTDGKEVAWIDRPSDLPQDVRGLIFEELASRELVPEIQKILTVSTFSTPSVWEVMTDRGATSLTLKGEEDIRRLGPYTMMITDSHGLHFLLRDILTLDKHSRRLLDRFL